MIRHLKHNEIDRKKWDACIGRSLNGLIYAYSWYLDIVSPGWEALAETGEGGNYTSVMPLTVRKKYGVHYLYPPYFAQQLGIFSEHQITPECAASFLLSIPAQFRFMEVHLNSHNTFEYAGFQIKKNTNIELDLSSTYEALSKKFSEDTKRNIRKSAKHGIIMNKEISPSELITLFRKNTGKKISNLKDANYKVLLRLINACIEKGCAETWGAFTREKKLCAGVVWLVKDGRAIFLFSATDAEAKRTGGMFFLIDRFIQKHAGKNMVLDFEGSNLPGLARFYRGFGSKETVYLQVRRNRLPKLVRWIKS